MPALPSLRQASPTSWFESEPARGLFALEQRLLLPRLAELPAKGWLWLAPSAGWLEAAALAGPGLRLHRQAHGYAGDARCALPLPLASESVNVVVLQHVTAADAAQLLAECERVLMPGGRLLLTSLNPFSPFRAHWRRHGMVVRTPQRLRQLLAGAGLECDATRYVGPLWQTESSGSARLAPLRAACLFTAEKRSPSLLGPRPLPIRWQRPVASPGMTRTILEPNEDH